MTKTVEDIQNDVIHTIGEKAEKFGFSRIAGQLEGLLFLSPQPLSLDEMARRLEVSKASVSTNIRLLERWKLVRRVFNRGDWKNYYELRGRLWEIETEIVTTILRDELERFTENLDRWKRDLAEAEDEDSDGKAFLLGRFEEIAEYLEAGRHVLTLLTREGKVTPAVIKKIQIH